MSLKNKRLFVTGGAGFVGSHLVDRLVDEEPESIVVASNFFLGKKENLNEASERFENLEIKKIDVGDEKAMNEEFETNSYDAVFNLAVVPLPTSLEKPEWTFQKNIDMTMHLCRLAREDKFKTLIQFSSSEAYGTAKHVPMDENHPTDPCTPYAASKAATDHLVLSYHKTFGIDTSIIRPFNQYGPRQNWGKYPALIPLTVRRIINDEDIILFGDGEQTRDFIYVTETADAAVKIYDARSTRGKIINIGSGKETSINRIIKLMTSYFNYSKLIVREDGRPGDVRRHFADISLAKKLIDFEPKICIEKGMKLTCSWYKEHIIKGFS